MQIFIHKKGQTLGPFDIEQIKQGLQANQYTLADLAHTPGIDGWKSLHDVLSFLRNQVRNGVPTQPILPPSPTPHPSTPQPSSSPATPQPHQGIPDVAGKVGDSVSGLLSNPAIRAFLNEEQDPQAVARVYDRLMQICMGDEQVLYIAVQKKLILNFSPAAVALTNKRVIMFRPQAFGLALSFDDHYWLNVVNVHISEAVLGSIFAVNLIDNRRVFVDSLPKAQARRLYQFGQQMEEYMHRHRRELMLEERRAGAGNFNVSMNNIQPPVQGMPYPQTSPQQQMPLHGQNAQEFPLASPHPAAPPAALPQASSSEDPLEKLGKLKTMLDRGLISQAEYDTKKAEIMARF